MKTFGSSVRLSARKVALIVVAIFVVLSLISVFSINLSDRASNEAALYKANYSIDKNGVYTISPKKGYDGFSSLTINVDVAGASVPASYTVSSVDELPSDVVDGSIALVDTPHPLFGTWVLNENISIPNIGISLHFTSNGTEFTGLSGYGSLSYYKDDTNITAYSSGAWPDEAYRTITITAKGDSPSSNYDTLATWLDANAIETVVDAYIQALYVRENGEWVYKCEIQ